MSTQTSLWAGPVASVRASGPSSGQTTPAPVLSRHGWHIIRLNALAPGQVLPFETVRPRIAEALEKAAWARASRDFVNRLGQKATITGASLAPI